MLKEQIKHPFFPSCPLSKPLSPSCLSIKNLNTKDTKFYYKVHKGKKSKGLTFLMDLRERGLNF
jgi:hypothetical protein